MWVRLLACVAAGLSLAACAGLGPGLTGNDTGGIIPSSVSRELARDIAAEHCARYGKHPVATSVDRRYGGYYAFQCRRDRRQRSQSVFERSGYRPSPATAGFGPATAGSREENASKQKG